MRDRSKRDVRLPTGIRTGVRTCTLDIDPGTWLHRSRQTPWITAGTLQDYLGPLPYCSWIGERTHNSAPAEYSSRPVIKTGTSYAIYDDNAR